MVSNRIILPLSVFLIAMAFALVFTNKVQKEGSEIEDDAHPMPELLIMKVLNHHKESVALEEVGEGFKLIYFGDVTSSDLDWEAIRKMERMASQNFKKPLIPIFISLDPKRDTIDRIASLLSKDNSVSQTSLPSISKAESNSHNNTTPIPASPIQALFPSPENLDFLTKAYGIRYQKTPQPNSKLEYTIDHNTWYYLTTPDYRILGSYPIQIHDERLKMEITAHMKQKH